MKEKERVSMLKWGEREVFLLDSKQLLFSQLQSAGHQCWRWRKQITPAVHRVLTNGSLSTVSPLTVSTIWFWEQRHILYVNMCRQRTAKMYLYHDKETVNAKAQIWKAKWGEGGHVSMFMCLCLFHQRRMWHLKDERPFLYWTLET